MALQLYNNQKIQSHQLYCQAAGSNGSDGSLQGNHIRWNVFDYNRRIYYPMGDYSPDPFNDVVTLYRMQFQESDIDNYASILKPTQTAPTTVDSNVWRYSFSPSYSKMAEFNATPQSSHPCPTPIINEDSLTFMLAGNFGGTIKQLAPAVTVNKSPSHVDVKFDWTPVTGVSSYRLYWLDSTDGNGNFAAWDLMNPAMTSAYWVCDVLSLSNINPTKMPLPQEEKLGVSNDIQLTFLDKAQYTTLAATNNPLTQFANIISNYTGVIEMEVLNKNAFAFGVELQSSGGSFYVDVETVSEINEDGVSAYSNTSRKRRTASTSPDTSYYYEENIRKVLFQYNNCKPVKLKLACYSDFIDWSAQNNKWTSLGEYGLTNSNTTADNRLRPADINNTWPRFVDSVKVKASNYQDKWSDTVNGLKKLVDNYVNDPLGSEIFSEDPNTDDTEIEIFYADMMDVISFDFHAARMLGLGHIDAFSGSQKYIYMAEYLNEELINPSAASAQQHLYVTLPTGTADSRLPLAPVPATTTFGITLSDTSENPPKMTDDNGYSLYEDARYVNLNVSNSQFYPGLTEFDAGGTQYSMGSTSVPVFSGARYRLQAGSWLVPGDLKDQEYQNPDSSDEILLLPYRNNTLFTHKLLEEGIFEYSLYTINWFSRPSSISSAINIGQTTFPVRNTLIPPANVQAVYIQEEDPLLITSQFDQDKLAAYKTAVTGVDPDGDYGLTRVTFEWNETHNKAYGYADKVEFLFKEEEPENIAGVIKNIEAYDTDKLKVYTGSYNLVMGNTTVSPDLDFGSNEQDRYIGSYFVSGQNQFPILDIQPGGVGEGPVFTILKLKIVETKNEESRGDYKPAIKYLVPVTGEIFVVPENLNYDGSWDKILTKKVSLVQFSSTTETVKTGDDTTRDLLVGGIVAPVTITEIMDGVNRTGAYELLFSGNPLTAHPDADVSWYKGSVRVPVNTNTDLLRSIEVWQITTSGSNLKLIAYDPFFEDVDTEIDTGSNITVHFHPGYRVYLKPETDFGRDEIVPDQGESIRKTMLAVRALDTSRSYHSAIATPSLLMGREIIEAAEPDSPAGPLFASRPDFFGMSSFTFNTQMNTTDGRVPFGMLFYKANESSILEALYKPETIVQIQNSLPSQLIDTLFTTRWTEFVNVITDVNGQFNQFDDYGFPMPDNDDTHPGFDGNTPPGDLEEDIKAIIRSVFTAMTSQPVIYSQVKNLSSNPVSPKEPVIRGANGQVLLPTDPLFDPFPMVRKFTDSGSTYLKFTDYKLDGASNNFYFYYAVELDSNFRVDYGKSSPVSKPVRLLNVKPATRPGIKQIKTVTADPYLEIPAGVQFIINPYLPDEGVARVKIFRTLSHADAISVRNMTEVKTVDIDEPIIDNFEDLDFPPFGELIYYRLAAVRLIRNEDDELEEIYSMPSEMVMANVVDVVNPPAPEINYSIGSTSSGPDKLLDIDLSWEPSAYNGKYYLYKMTETGNWQKVDEQVSNASMTFNVQELLKEDTGGDTIYHRYKVVAENANGLLTLDEKPLVL